MNDTRTTTCYDRPLKEMNQEQIEYARRYSAALRDKLRKRLLSSELPDPITPDQVKWFVQNAILDALNGMREFDEDDKVLLSPMK